METQNPESTLMITPSEVIEHLYCPRFTYFMNCLNIPQHEELRYKVMKGRTIHERKERENTEYLRKKIKCTGKEISVYLASPTIRVRGIVDEVLFLADGTASPFDYKYAEFTDFIFTTHKVQSVLYAMLIQEIYKMPVKKGFICYTRGSNTLKEIIYGDEDFRRAKDILEEIFSIILQGHFPMKKAGKNRCPDCCYKNICI